MLVPARAGVADPRGFDQPGGLGVGARGDRMGDGLAGHLVIAMPGVRPAVQGRGRARLPPLELDPQQLGEQRVEAVPPALVIQGDKEEVAGRQRGEHRSGVLLLQYRIAQRAGQPSRIEERSISACIGGSCAWSTSVSRKSIRWRVEAPSSFTKPGRSAARRSESAVR